MRSTRWRWLALPLLLVLISETATYSDAATPVAAPHSAVAPTDPQHMFIESGRCIGCHSNLTAPSGEDMSFGFQWRATMMALSARDPYWRAGVRRT